MFTTTIIKKWIIIKKYIFEKPLNIEKAASLLDGYHGITIQRTYRDSIYLTHESSNYLLLFKGRKVDIRFKLPLLWKISMLGIPILLLALKIAFENYLTNFWNGFVSVALLVFSIAWILYGATLWIKFKTKKLLTLFREKIIANPAKNQTSASK